MTEPNWHPSFIVIGAVKAATTWIQMRLQDNPEVYLPNPEPHYFSTGFEQGEEYYRSFFIDRPAEACVIGEKSADYLAHPLAAQRMAAMLPDLRLVVQLRAPVERAYSHYKMLYRRGTISGPPEDYLTSLDSPYPNFLRDGLYAHHLARWFDHFPPDQLLVFLYEEVGERPRQIVEAVSAHIGVKTVFCNELAYQRENNSRAAILPLSLRKPLSPFKSTVRSLRGARLFEGIRSLLAREPEYPPLSPLLRKRLVDFYAADVETLEKTYGLDLRHWKESWPREGQSPPVVAQAESILRFPTGNTCPRRTSS